MELSLKTSEAVGYQKSIKNIIIQFFPLGQMGIHKCDISKTKVKAALATKMGIAF